MDNMLFDFIKYVWPILALPIMWLFKQVNELKKDYYETKVHAAQTFVAKDDYRDDLKSLHIKLDVHAAKQEAMAQKIYDKLDGKVDKK